MTPEHSSPHCVAEWGSERIQRVSELIWKFELSPWTPVPVRVSVAPTPSAFGETGQENGVRGSAYCSASLRAADYDHHECQALIRNLYTNLEKDKTALNWKLFQTEFHDYESH